MNSSDISKDMTIEELVERYPHASRFFIRYGIRCFTCSGVLWGTIEEALARKGVENIDEAVDQLRAFATDEPDQQENRPPEACGL